MRVDGLFNDRKPETGAMQLSGVSSSKEAIEDMGQILIGDTRALVTH